MPPNILRFLLLFCILLSVHVNAVEITVEVNGLNDTLKHNVLALLSLQQVRTQTDLTPERINSLHRIAPGEIRLALQPFGYFKPIVASTLEATAQGFLARYDIKPGEPVKIVAVDFQVQGAGKDDPLFVKAFPIKVGSILDQALYERTKQDLLARAIEQGYIKAHYTRHEIIVDLILDEAQLYLYLDTGILFKFGETRFMQDVLDVDFLARYPQYQPGDRLQQEKLLTLQANLIDSEYFKQVDVQMLPEQVLGDQVPIELQLIPNLPNRYRAGIGFATDVGPRLTFDWARRRMDRQGAKLNTELRLSVPFSRLKTEYSIPLERPWQDSLVFAVEAEHFDSDTRQGNRAALGAAYNLGAETAWRRTLALEYSYERSMVADVTDAFYHLIPSVTWTQLQQHQGFSGSGYKISLQLLGAAVPFSSSNFMQGRAHGKLIAGLNPRWRLLARNEFGVSFASALADLPASKRFFAGGDSSVRGYTLDQLGPKDNTDKVSGGRFLAVGSVELERRIVGNWSSAVFYDVGNAFELDKSAEFAQGAGFGVRWRSPVGLVRVDLACGLNAAANPWRLHVVVGPDL